MDHRSFFRYCRLAVLEPTSFSAYPVLDWQPRSIHHVWDFAISPTSPPRLLPHGKSAHSPQSTAELLQEILGGFYKTYETELSVSLNPAHSLPPNTSPGIPEQGICLYTHFKTYQVWCSRGQGMCCLLLPGQHPAWLMGAHYHPHFGSSLWFWAKLFLRLRAHPNSSLPWSGKAVGKSSFCCAS